MNLLFNAIFFVARVGSPSLPLVVVLLPPPPPPHHPLIHPPPPHPPPPPPPPRLPPHPPHHSWLEWSALGSTCISCRKSPHCDAWPSIFLRRFSLSPPSFRISLTMSEDVFLRVPGGPGILLLGLAFRVYFCGSL